MEARTDQSFAPRRGFLAGLSASLVLPWISGTAATGAGRVDPEGRRTLSPAHPDAVRLARLYEAMRRSWPAEAEARHALGRIVEARADDIPELVAHYKAMCARNLAHLALAGAVLQVAGVAKPDADRWERFGLPLATVCVGSRLYVVSATDQAEYQEDPDDFGSIAMVVIDL